MDLQPRPPQTPAEQALVDTFAAELGTLPGDARIASERDRLLTAFRAAGLPSRRVEAWHYTDMRTLLRAVPPAGDIGAADPRPPLRAGSPVLAVVQGMAARAPSIDGVAVEALASRLSAGHPGIRLEDRGADDLVGRLNGAFLTDGFAVDVADGTAPETPIEIQAVQNGGHAHSRFPVRVGAGAKVTFVERQAAPGERTGFSSSLTEIEVGADADVTWIIFQERGEADIHLGQFIASIGARARLTLFIVNSGGKLVRQEVHVSTVGEGAHFDLRGVNLLAGDSHTDITMTLGHDVPHTTSREIVRNVVFGRARGAFQGQIKVARNAQKTDAQMACNTLLLSEEGEFDAKPELEIFADDVVCGHGATVVDLDENHLFYLMARGIGEKTARGLLIKAFLAEVIEELSDEALVEALESRLDAWFATHG